MRRLAAEQGNALVTALLLMMVMLTVGLAGLAQVDTQQQQSGVERVRETTFNLAEGVLNAQIFALSQRWPGPGAGTAPATAQLGFGICTEASDPLTSPNCPSAATIRRLFTSPDTDGSIAWRTEVRDNASSVPLTCSSSSASTTFYSDASTAGQPAYDCNGDGRLWARAQATVRGRTRAVVALAQTERETHQMPRSALFAGRLEIGNSGNKVIVDAKADTALSTAITLRCTPTSQTTCVGYEGLLDTVWSTTKLATQLNGTKPQPAYTGPPVLSAEALERLKRTAITNGTYYQTCPTDASGLAGAVVYVETCNQSYQSNAVINSPQSPGALIIGSGSIRFLGTTVFNGIIYHRNQSSPPSTDILVDLSGNNGGGVAGAVFVEGQGGFKIGGSALLTVDGRAFEALRSYGSAGIIQNTWREIPAAAPVGGQTPW